MGYLVGTDEAGYAPNLGPLVISATVWSVPGDPSGVDLYRLLNKAVARSPATRKGPPRRVVLADSKVVYKPPGGIGELELGVLAALGLAGVRPATWRDCWRLLDPASVPTIDALPWHASFQRDLPLAADRGHLDRLGTKLGREADGVGIRLLSVRSRAIFPDDWNRLTDEHNKSTALSLLTLELLSQVLAGLDEQPVAVVCDKHGGRNFYQPLLQRHVEHVVEVYGEGRQASVYRWGPVNRRTEVMFCVNAERYLPCALASMASKYLRELSMLAFNDYWRAHLPDLRPTAGYPLDARRFKSDIAAVQQSLGIDDRAVWRYR